MQKLFILALSVLAFTACSRVPAPKPVPAVSVLLITPADCEVLRVSLASGAYSPAFGGAAGIFVPDGGLSLAIPIKQLECRRDGVFQPL